MRSGLLALVLAGVCGFAGVAAEASPVVLGFGTTPNGKFTSYTKAGYTVSNAGADHWYGSTTGGNPGAGLIAGKAVGGGFADNSASLTIGRGGYEFKVLAFQVDDYGKDVSFTLSAYNAGTLLFSISGSDSINGWATVIVPPMYQVYATGYLLTMNIGPLSTGSKAEFGLDNIIVDPTPEPGSLALLSTGMMAAMGLVWRRRMVQS